MDNANTPENQTGPTESGDFISHATPAHVEEFLQAIAFGLDRIEAMSPTERAELALQEFPLGEE